MNCNINTKEMMTNKLVSQAETILKEQGGRMTSQRKLILEKIESMSGHPTAEEIFLNANQDDPTLNLSTVYRTLRWLTDQSLITPHRFDEERRQERFDATLTGTLKDHYHFQCTQCKNIFEFSSDQMEKIKSNFSSQTGAEVFSAELVLYGLCANCRENRS